MRRSTIDARRGDPGGRSRRSGPRSRPTRGGTLVALALALALALVWLLLPAPPAGATGEVILASHVPESGVTTANAQSAFAASSDDGAYVVFASTATNLVAGQTDANNGPDVFLFERATGAVTLVSHVPGAGTTTANGGSSYPKVSADGSFVVFYSGADNLVAGQSGPLGNLFLFERTTGAVRLVSHAAGSATTAGGGAYPIPSVTPDAASVAFSSTANNLVTGQVDNNGGEDAFVFDRATGEITLVSHMPGSPTTAPPAHGARTPSISANGAVVAFSSGAPDLVEHQKDARYYTDDVFLFERATGRITLVSHVPGRASTTANAPSDSPSVSGDGSLVVFQSSATDLVGRKGDANGTFDVFLFDRASASVRLISHTPGSDSATGANSSHSPLISADGSAVTFTSFAGNLVPGQDDAGDDPDVFLFDVRSGELRLVSHTPGSTSVAADHDPCCHTGSQFPSVSSNGRYIAFMSTATNLVERQNDSRDLHTDIFLFERATGTVSLVSHIPGHPTKTADLSSGLRPGGRGPENETPSVSADGTVVFVSLATNLVPGQVDTNGTIDVFVSSPG